jgi:hypothetical protein
MNIHAGRFCLSYLLSTLPVFFLLAIVRSLRNVGGSTTIKISALLRFDHYGMLRSYLHDLMLLSVRVRHIVSIIKQSLFPLIASISSSSHLLGQSSHKRLGQWHTELLGDQLLLGIPHNAGISLA